MYGFPRTSPLGGKKLLRVAFPTNATQTQFTLPRFASLAFPIRAYHQTPSATVMIAPDAMALVRGYSTEDYVRSATITGDGSTPTAVGDGDAATAWSASTATCSITIDVGVSRVIALVALFATLVRTYQLDASDDQIQWTAIIPSTYVEVRWTAFERYTFTATTVPFRYWRVTCGSVDWFYWGTNWGTTVQRISLYEERLSTTAVRFAIAPATGTLILEYVAA